MTVDKYGNKIWRNKVSVLIIFLLMHKYNSFKTIKKFFFNKYFKVL